VLLIDDGGAPHTIRFLERISAEGRLTLCLMFRTTRI
jgi:hypothetical protein